MIETGADPFDLMTLGQEFHHGLAKAILFSFDRQNALSSHKCVRCNHHKHLLTATTCHSQGASFKVAGKGQ